MEVKLAKSAGFCFGVERAVDICYKEAENSKDKIFTLGPIIHNEDVVESLRKNGINVINTPEEITDPENTTVIIRSHGVKKEVIDKLNEMGVNVVSATCPFVTKIQMAVQKAYNNGIKIVIIGNPNHPEVKGINGWCNDSASIVENEEDAEKIECSDDTEVLVVAQTTFNSIKFKYIVDILKKNCYNIKVMNTICNATEERQSEAREIAKNSDAMLVIGGKHSSNTQKLYEICKEECSNTHFIQTLDDLSSVELKSFRSVGITAGASTPNKIIKEVQSYVSREQ